MKVRRYISILREVYDPEIEEPYFDVTKRVLRKKFELLLYFRQKGLHRLLWISGHGGQVKHYKDWFTIIRETL